MKNFAFEKTPKPDQKWIELSEDKRIEAVHNQISKDKTFEDFEIHKAFDDGQVIFKVNKAIPSNVRGPLLLDLEEKLKKNIDNGLTVWFEPVGDKSKLRNLRGITINQEKE